MATCILLPNPQAAHEAKVGSRADLFYNPPAPIQVLVVAQLGPKELKIPSACFATGSRLLHQPPRKVNVIVGIVAIIEQRNLQILGHLQGERFKAIKLVLSKLFDARILEQAED